ncbi:MAG: SulP family inorganic anion transporter [Planctomycetaceae bacterium]
MARPTLFSSTTLPRDLTAGMVVFLVAVPLCLGVSLASNAPLISGVLTGIVGGLVVAVVSRSQTSVSGPGAGLTAIVAAQIAALGSFETFLLAVVLAGIIQIALGLARGGFIAAFFPMSVIKGLLAAIGIILILKQIPHLLGHDTDPEGEMSFLQPDRENTFSELVEIFFDFHGGAALIGLLSIAVLVCWDRLKFQRKYYLPGPLIVVLLGVLLNELFQMRASSLAISGTHLVQVPVADSFAGFLQFLRFPNFGEWSNPLVYKAAITIALVASLESLLNLEAIDRLDPKQRTSPPSRELVAQGVGNMVADLIGGIPLTTAIVRSSVNINSGSQTKLSTIVHGLLLLLCVVMVPTWLNSIPISCLAAILFVTGFKLADPRLFYRMGKKGFYQLIPFLATILAIVFTDLLLGILIGLGVSLSFILYSNFRTPVSRILEKHLGGEVLHVELPNQVSFFKRAAIEKILDELPRGGHVLIDARDSNYIDAEVLDMIRDYRDKKAQTRGVDVSLLGFQEHYALEDKIQFADFSSRDLQEKATPYQILEILKEGHQRFTSGKRLMRDLSRQVYGTADSQHPLAVVLSCIDSRAPAELIFDLGVGDIFSARVAGNIVSHKLLGSMEYACGVAGAKLILVMGHTRCGAVTTALKFIDSPLCASDVTGCENINGILSDIHESLDLNEYRHFNTLPPEHQELLASHASRDNVQHMMQRIMNESTMLNRLVSEGKIAIVGAVYDVATGKIEFLNEEEALTLTHR